MKIIFNKVPVTERLPNRVNEKYLTLTIDNVRTSRFFNGTRFETADYEGDVFYWLEETDEIEMVNCECGHTVPLEFSVSDTEDGNATCMPCIIEAIDVELLVVGFQRFCFNEGWKQMDENKFQKSNWKNMSGTNQQQTFCTSQELWALYRVKLEEEEEKEQFNEGNKKHCENCDNPELCLALLSCAHNEKPF